MTKEQWELYKEFCEFADLQDNSDAERANAVSSMKMYIDGTMIDSWDPIDDFSVITPEFLVYILSKAEDFFKGRGEEK